MNRARPLALVGSLAVAGLCLLALRTGSAAIDARLAQDTLVRLDAGQALPAAALQRARDAAFAARRAAPRRGAPDEWLARLAVHAAGAAGDGERRRRLLLEAREHALAAWSARPRWPYAAVVVATVEAADQRHGERFQRAVADAWRFGARERRVRESLAGLWLRAAARDAAPELSPAFGAALARDPDRWIDAADRAGAGPEACARRDAPARAIERCHALGWAPPATAAGPRG